MHGGGCATPKAHKVPQALVRRMWQASVPGESLPCEERPQALCGRRAPGAGQGRTWRTGPDREDAAWPPWRGSGSGVRTGGSVVAGLGARQATPQCRRTRGGAVPILRDSHSALALALHAMMRAAHTKKADPATHRRDRHPSESSAHRTRQTRRLEKGPKQEQSVLCHSTSVPDLPRSVDAQRRGGTAPRVGPDLGEQ